MTPPLDQSYRGSAADRPRGVPLPPDHLALIRAGQLRKSWRYVSFWSRELSFCAATVKVGVLQKEYWGIWDRAARQFRQGSHFFTHCVQHESNCVRVNDADVEINVTFAPANSFELYRPAKRAYIWAHKDYCPQARGTVRYGSTVRPVKGVLLVDIQAGYHERHTQWRWVAGAGLDQYERLVGFSAISGVFDSPSNSERTIWIDDVAKEVGPNTFSEDLSTISFSEGGTLHFESEALIERHDNLLAVRSDYLHWFGTFTGTLPGGIELREAYGVRERHDALW